MTLDDVVESTPLDGHDGRSGATIERAVLSDGSRVVVKRSTGDLVAVVTGDDGREARLWSSGALDRLPAGVGHAVLSAGRVGDEMVTRMRDLTGHVLTWDRTLSAAEVDRIFAAAATVHDAFASAVPEGLCALGTRLPVLYPATLAAVGESHPLPALVNQGWECFAELAPADIVAEVFATHADPAPLLARLAAAPKTLAHGDFTLPNLALTPDEVVLLDWSLATEGPGVLDYVCFIASCASNVDMDYAGLLAAVRRACGDSHDEETLRAALYWGLTELGWNKALDAATHPDPAKRAAERAELDWWVAQGRAALA
ncbi:MAG TPA: phosphotransferase [Actinokineospora sp.]|jgi:hypothetical protein|nr:phosphotransferase [Actinokineospora sp.]